MLWFIGTCSRLASLPPPPFLPFGFRRRGEPPGASHSLCQRLATKLPFTGVNHGLQGTRLRSGSHSGPDNGFLQSGNSQPQCPQCLGPNEPRPYNLLCLESFDGARVLTPLP